MSSIYGICRFWVLHITAINMPTKPWEELHQAVSETHPQLILLPHKVFDDTLYYSQQPITFVKEFNYDDVAQIYMESLEENINEIYKKFKIQKDDNDQARSIGLW